MSGIEITAADREAAALWALSEAYLIDVESLARVFAARRIQARNYTIEEAVHIATYELVDAEATGDETDAAYNRGIMDAITAIRNLSTQDTPDMRATNKGLENE
jgi:hypothetical protein